MRDDTANPTSDKRHHCGMPITVHNKLVRDRIPELIEANGGRPRVEVLDGPAARHALIDKLVEEAGELRQAPSFEDSIAELCDLLEVLQALAHECGVSWETVSEAADVKRAENGGFRGRILLIDVDGPEWPGS